MNPNTFGHDVPTTRISQNGSAPPCHHADAIVPVVQRSTGCRDCQASGSECVSLMICLTCGWVACSDESPRRHALAHYEETDHPVVGALEPGSTFRWCYLHGRAV
jgi:uncharacterized UBP type Zn finger protein